jgi:ETFB lysine methyltransferase
MRYCWAKRRNSRSPLPSEPRRVFDLTETHVQVAQHAWSLVHPCSSDSLIDEAAFEQDERLPYWADIWPSSRVLAGLLVRHHGDGRRALELGCGSGLVACALAVAGYAVTATDYYEAALETTRRNVQRNTGIHVDTRLVDWRAIPDDLGTFDVVVASDVLYERAYGPLVAEVMARTLAPHGFVMLADPGRLALAAFLERAAELGLRLHEGWEVDFPHEGQDHSIRVRVLQRMPSPAS